MSTHRQPEPRSATLAATLLIFASGLAPGCTRLGFDVWSQPLGGIQDARGADGVPINDGPGSTADRGVVDARRGDQRPAETPVGDQGQRPADAPVGDQDPGTADTSAAEWRAANDTGVFGQGSWRFGPVQHVRELNSNQDEADLAFVGDDGRTAYISSARAGGLGQLDIYVVSRPSRQEPFGPFTPLTAMNTDGHDSLVQSDDGLWAVLCTWRPGAPRGAELWFGTRTNASAPWRISLFTAATALNSASDEWDPTPSRDFLRIYFAADNAPGSVGGQDIVVATRDTTADAFSTPTPVANINSSASDADPTLSPDERVIVFVSDRPNGMGGSDLWYATRSAADAPFGSPQPIPGLNTGDEEREPTLSPDGSELYFASNRPGTLGGLDFYRVAVLSGP